MTTPDNKSTSSATLQRSAIFCLLLVLILLYLLWRGPPTHAALARLSYLEIDFIYYPLMAILAVIFSAVAVSNIRQIRNRSSDKN